MHNHVTLYNQNQVKTCAISAGSGNTALHNSHNNIAHNKISLSLLVSTGNIILEWTTSLDTSSRTLFVCRGVGDRGLCPAGFIAHLFAP